MKKHIFYLLLIISFVYGLISNLSFVETLKLKTFDALVKEHKPSEYFTILNITDDDVRERGGYPFPRQDLAEIQTELFNNGAIGVGWVISFIDKDRFGGDEIFAESIANLPVVIATFETDNNINPPTAGTVILGEDAEGIRARGYMPNVEIIRNVAQEGLVSAPVDVDNLVRRIPLLYQTDKGWTPSYAIQVLKVLADSSTYIIKTNPNGIEEISVRGIPPTPLDVTGRKWISWVDTPQTTLQEMNVENKFVFIGVTAKGVMPQVATPVGLLEPHKVQAALAESILIQDSPYIPHYSLLAELSILIASTLLVWIALNVLNLSFGLVGALLVTGGTAYLGLHFIRQGLLIDVTWTLIANVFTGATAFYLNYREQYKLRQQIKKQFGTYLSPDMVAMLQKNPELLKLGGERKEMTFLFTDIMGFTPVSEVFKNKDDPEGLVELINTYLDKMTKIILANGGTIDKYMGDCIMAFWNAPLPCKNHAELAIKSALEIEQATIELNKQFKEEGLDLPPINVGTGVNSGTCIVGNMGSETRFDYSVVGDAVNLSARLEATAGRNDYKEWKIIISEYTKELAGNAFKYEKIGNILVKGKSEPITIYSPKIYTN